MLKTILSKKAWLPLLLLSLVLLTALCACNGDGDSVGTADNGGTNEDGTPIYTADTTVFETFKDMQANVELFRDQLPCTRTTKGYHTVGAGGGTYLITTSKPEGAFIRLADGIFAQLQVSEGMTEVSPEHFGAIGNGVNNDTVAIHRATEFAEANALKLHLTGDYYTLMTLKWNNINVQSDNARISYYGKEFNQPAVDMYENVNIYGKINIFADIYHPAGTHGNRCGMAFGNYDTGRGAKNCYIEHIVIWGGGMNGANAILMTGDSSNITFGTIEVPEGHNSVNVPIMMHWGNYAQHHPADLLDPSNSIYVHEEGYTPTTHPHDITIGLINSHAQHTALYISACYNITVDEVRQYGGMSAVRVVPGDVGFLYASEAEKAHGAKNMYIKKVTGINLTDLGMYFNGVDCYEPGVRNRIQVRVDEATLIGTPDNNANGICFYGVADGQFGKIAISNFGKPAVQLGYCNTGVKINELTATNCKHHIFTGVNDLNWSRYGYTETREPTTGFEINKMTVTGGGNGATFANLVNIAGLHIKELTVNQTSFSSLFQLWSTTKNLIVDQVYVTPTTNGHSGIVHAQEAVASSNNISITIKNPTGFFNDKYGKSCDITLIKN